MGVQRTRRPGNLLHVGTSAVITPNPAQSPGPAVSPTLVPTRNLVSGGRHTETGDVFLTPCPERELDSGSQPHPPPPDTALPGAGEGPDTLMQNRQEEGTGPPMEALSKGP